MDRKRVLLVTHLSFMNKIRSLANSPRLDKHENPNSANVKKKMPVRTGENRGKRKQTHQANSYPTDFGEM
jgi:hypothetical protein